MTDTLTYFYFISFSIWPEHQVDANFIHKLLSIVILFNLSCGIYSVAVRFLLKLADILQSFPVPTAVIVLHARSSSSTVKSVILSKEVVSRKVEKSEVISSNQVRLIYHLCFILLILFGTKLCYNAPCIIELYSQLQFLHYDEIISILCCRSNQACKETWRLSTSARQWRKSGGRQKRRKEGRSASW